MREIVGMSCFLIGFWSRVASTMNYYEDVGLRPNDGNVL